MSKFYAVALLAGAAALFASPQLCAQDAQPGKDDKAAEKAAEGVQWETNLDAALARAAKEGKKVFIKFTAEW